MSFKSDISKFKLQTLKKIERTRKGATFRLFAAVIRDTPVGHPDTWNMTEAQKNAVKKSGYTGGSLRNSWICTQNAPASGVRDSEDDGAEADALDTINTSRGDCTLYLTNNQKYAGRVEFDGWSHTKSPQGMVRKNIRRFHALFQEALKSS